MAEGDQQHDSVEGSHRRSSFSLSRSPAAIFARSPTENTCRPPIDLTGSQSIFSLVAFQYLAANPLLQSQSADVEDEMQASCTDVADRRSISNFQDAFALVAVKPANCQPPIV